MLPDAMPMHARSGTPRCSQGETMPRLPRGPKGRKAKAEAACECGTLDAFLAQLTAGEDRAEILLSPIYQTLAMGSGTTRVQAGVLLTGRHPRTSVICSCLVLAVEARLVGERGRLTYPARGKADDPRVRERIHALQRELLTAISSFLQGHPRVAHIAQPAAYRVPAGLTWQAGALAGTPLTYTDGHWTLRADTAG